MKKLFTLLFCLAATATQAQTTLAQDSVTLIEKLQYRDSLKAEMAQWEKEHTLYSLSGNSDLFLATLFEFREHLIKDQTLESLSWLEHFAKNDSFSFGGLVDPGAINTMFPDVRDSGMIFMYTRDNPNYLNTKEDSVDLNDLVYLPSVLDIDLTKESFMCPIMYMEYAYGPETLETQNKYFAKFRINSWEKVIPKNMVIKNESDPIASITPGTTITIRLWDNQAPDKDVLDVLFDGGVTPIAPFKKTIALETKGKRKKNQVRFTYEGTESGTIVLQGRGIGNRGTPVTIGAQIIIESPNAKKKIVDRSYPLKKGERAQLLFLTQ